MNAAAAPARATQYLEQFADTEMGVILRQASPEQARLLCALFSGSSALTEWLLTHPEWLPAVINAEALAHPRQMQGLRREVDEWLPPALAKGEFAGALGRLRQFKQSEMLRIAVRDLAGLGDVPEIVGELSNVADVCLSGVWEVCAKQLANRLGRPYHQNAEGRWQPTQFAVIGLGKLGGQELNYSSDVDVIFVYDEEGNVFKEPPRKAAAPGRALSNHQFFTRLAGSFVAEISRPTPEGTLYRIDLRLRPEGEAGPLVRGLGSYENVLCPMGTDLGAHDVDQGPGSGGRSDVGGRVYRDDPTLPLSAFAR